MKVLFVSLGILVLAGCAGQNVKDASTQAPNQKQAAVTNKATEIDPLSDPKSPLAKRSVYFGFDQYAVKDTYKPTLEAHAQYLSGHAGAKVTIEGNTDERGSSEYNLALGNRRAENVKKVLAVLGTSDKQIEVVSLGKEKPKATCHEESCWSENRRADIVYSTSK